MGSAETPAFASSAEAVQAMLAAAGFLADADHPEMPGAEKAQCLLGLERFDAVAAVARGGLLAAFDAADDYEADGQASTSAWLVNTGRITRAEAGAHRAWVRRRTGHPLIMAALRDGALHRSWAVKVMSLTGKIPDDFRPDAEKIIVAAAAAGAQLKDLVYIATEVLARTAPPDPEKGFTDRQLRLERTLDGAGVLTGDLSPECAAAAQAVLGELAKRSGPDDERSQPERMHDGLLEAMTRLLGSELMPKRNGHPVQAIVHINLADMLSRQDGSPLVREWSARLAAQWAGQTAAAAEAGGDGGAWLAGPAASGLTCDAALFPLVTASPDVDALDELVRLCVRLDGYRHGSGGTPAEDAAAEDAAAEETGVKADPGVAQELMRQIIEQAVKLMSGEAGLASFLRRNMLGGLGLGGPSLPLDVGDVDTVPWWLRRAVTARDQGCRWPGGCDKPAQATQPHHVAHREHHGPTSLTNLLSLCFYHHHVTVHRDGWTVKVHGDGTAEARSPDGTSTYRRPRRPPPPRPG